MVANFKKKVRYNTNINDKDKEKILFILKFIKPKNP